jgi:hypothetical protein
MNKPIARLVRKCGKAANSPLSVNSVCIDQSPGRLDGDQCSSRNCKDGFAIIFIDLQSINSVNQIGQRIIMEKQNTIVGFSSISAKVDAK